MKQILCTSHTLVLISQFLMSVLYLKFADVNVEHMQVLMFLFHGLRLTQKKTILVKIYQIVLSVAQIDGT